MIGIYKIENKINGHIYIGQSVNIERRFQEHKGYHRKNHPEKVLYKAFTKYGIDNFSFDIIEECSKELLDEREIYWISYFNSFHNGYNETAGGLSGNGQKGEQHPNHILTQKEVDKIIKLLQQDFPYKKIIEQVPNATEDMIWSINQGHRWKQSNLSYPIRKREGSKRFSDETALLILKKYSEGKTFRELAKEFNCCAETIKNLVQGKTYKYLPREVQYEL